MMKRGIGLILNIIVMIASGMGSVFLLKLGSWINNSPVDFASDIIFSYELGLVGVILFIGIIVLIYLRFTGKA